MYIATRASPLAQIQADLVKAHLQEYFPSLRCEKLCLKTKGDSILGKALSDVGGKGLFSKEIDNAVLEGRADIAVHSMKDMETILPNGLVIGAVLRREDARDAFISHQYKSLKDMPEGGVVGTASIRRQSQILHKFPHLKCIIFRGNVQTRLQKLHDGMADATLLAMAGLNRLSMSHLATDILSCDDMLPAVGQGVLAITCRENDTEVRAILKKLHDEESHIVSSAERHFLKILDGSCRTPIAGYAQKIGDSMHFEGLLASEDGKKLIRDKESCPFNMDDAIHMAGALAKKIISDFHQ
jgi:hydroxymethylbilane synthase